MENDDKVIELTDEVEKKIPVIENFMDERLPGDKIEEELVEQIKQGKEAKEKVVVKLNQEPKKQVMMSATEKVIQQLNQKIEQAEESGSYYVTITRKEGEKLKHWMGSIKFPKDDRAHSLRELLKMVPAAYHGKKGNVRKFGPRKHGG